MNTYLRFDSVGGASGDMILSALAALGADVEAIERTLNAFFPESLHIHADPAAESGLNGLRVTVHAEHHHHDESVWPDAHTHAEYAHAHDHDAHHAHHAGHTHRGLPEIEALLTHAAVSGTVRTTALAVFRALAEAEAEIHGKTPETVHFHEVGAWDSVADIVGSCLALEQLGVTGVSCGPLPAGIGTIHCAHGEMPNPAPATQALLSGMAVTQTEEPFELVTPTGAALLRVWTRTLAPVPATAAVVRSAFGFGGRQLAGRPNVLRATLLSACDAACAVSPAAVSSDLLVLETNLDDCNPEWIGAVTSGLSAQGALDVWCAPVLMKKGRPGTMLSVLTDAEHARMLSDLIFRSTTTFGIRSYAVTRQALTRRFDRVSTPWGEVPVKVGLLPDGEAVTGSPEYEACAALAQAHHIAPRKIHEAAQAAWLAAQHTETEKPAVDAGGTGTIK